MEVFPAFHAVPFSKMLTFFKSDTFQVAGEYCCQVPYSDKHIGIFEIGDVKSTAEGGNWRVKVKVCINLNGVFVVGSINVVVKREIREGVPVEMEVDNKKEDGRMEGEVAGGSVNFIKMVKDSCIFIGFRAWSYLNFLGASYVSATIFIVIVGAVVFVVAFFGCCGAWKEGKCVSCTCAVFLVFLLIAQIGAGIVVYMFGG